MDALTSIEDRRLALQIALDAEKTLSERNRLGQFATPTGLASDVVAYAHGLLGDDTKVRFLDPAIGTGSFYSALVCELDESRIETAAGIEIDSHYGKPASDLWEAHRLKLTLGDFTAMSAPLQGEGFNLIIAILLMCVITT